jgi:Pilus formation protein N terminal region
VGTTAVHVNGQFTEASETGSSCLNTKLGYRQTECERLVAPSSAASDVFIRKTPNARALLLPTAALLCATILNGCGGSASTASPSAPPATPPSDPSSASATSEAPIIDPIPDLSNSPDARDVVYPLQTHAANYGTIVATVVVSNPAVAEAKITSNPLSLVITPFSRGVTQLTVKATAGAHTFEQTLKFTVGEVAKTLTLTAASPAEMALVLTNDSDRQVDFAFEHNGFPAFQSRQEIVDFVKAMPESYVGEPFERKLWRFLVDNTFHWAPVSPLAFVGDPWVEINSLGWGYCGEVAAAYVLIAREAGYAARVWGLSGHVVSEISIGSRWEMYDADLVAYYYDRDNQLAGVEELAADPSLITNPINPLHPTWLGYGPYSQVVADIYSSTADNWIDEGVFLPTTTSPPARVWVPAHATLTYPGIWTVPPIGLDGTTSIPVAYYKQARLDLPAGWTGHLALPWMPWDIQGVGHVVIGGTTYTAGSDALRAALQQSTSMVTEIWVADSSALSVIMMVNALRYTLDAENTVKLNGVDVWAISGGTTSLPAANQVMPVSVLLPGQLKGPIS